VTTTSSTVSQPTQQPPPTPPNNGATEQSKRAAVATVAQYTAIEKEEFEELTRHANSVNGRIATQQQKQAQQDPAPPPNADIAATQQRLQQYLAQVQAALRRADVQEGQRFIDKASAELAKLEKFASQ
jgi:hypothetical protein